MFAGTGTIIGIDLVYGQFNANSAITHAFSLEWLVKVSFTCFSSFKTGVMSNSYHCVLSAAWYAPLFQSNKMAPSHGSGASIVKYTYSISMPSTNDKRLAGIVRLVIPTGKVITVSPNIGESQSLYKRKPKFFFSPKSLLSDKVKSLLAV